MLQVAATVEEEPSLQYAKALKVRSNAAVSPLSTQHPRKLAIGQGSVEVGKDGDGIWFAQGDGALLHRRQYNPRSVGEFPTWGYPQRRFQVVFLANTEPVIYLIKNINNRDNGSTSIE